MYWTILDTVSNNSLKFKSKFFKEAPQILKVNQWPSSVANANEF
jgi:hypothetical protein